MKVIILAGGYGTRLGEYTESIPKPMVTIGGNPILWHIMNSFAKYDHKDFFVALGYKAHIIKDYFLNYRALNSDFTVDLSTGKVKPLNQDAVDWQITLIDTGISSMTGGRIKRMRDFIGNEKCLVTYGDGLSDINLDELVEFHKSHGKLVTVTAVHPAARFGELDIQNNAVLTFQEKPQTKQGWINGGYFVVEPEFFNLISGDSTMLEREPLEQAAEAGELMAYHHDSFWHCMDTKRDLDLLEAMWAEGAPWKV